MTLHEVLLVLSLGLVGFCSVVSLCVKPAHRLFAVALCMVAAAWIAIGIISWLEPLHWIVAAPLRIGPFPIHVVTDKLSSIFLILLALITGCCAIFSVDYIRHSADKINPAIYWSALFLFVAGMASVMLAGDAVFFLVAWEIMSLASAVLVVSEFRQHKAQRAAIIYLVATRIATGLLGAGFILMFVKTGSWILSAWHFTDSSTWLAATLIMCGLMMKAGMFPFHIWLPHAHPEAPSPVSALMSGVMVKVPIYAALRLFVLGGLSFQVLIYVLFFLAVVSAFWGVLFATNQREIKRLLAYSTIENVGLILLGLSITLWCRNAGYDVVAQIALAALLLQCIGHAVFKSLLFLCAGSIDYGAHTRELAHLGGLIKKMPYTSSAFIIGSAAICAVPPLIGFVSKWYLYQSLFNASLVLKSPVDRGICVGAIGVLACVGALAIACFAKAIGVALLGKGRSHRAHSAHEAPFLMLMPILILVFLCVSLGFATPYVVPHLGLVLHDGMSSSSSILVPQFILPLTAAILIVGIVLYLFILSRRPRIYITWDCGFGALTARAQVAADSFAQPIARIFTPVFRHAVAVEISGKDRRHFPEKVHVEPSMVSLLETQVYAPLGKALHTLSRWLAKFQAGSIHLYLMYVCISLVLLVLLGTYAW